MRAPTPIPASRTLGALALALALAACGAPQKQPEAKPEDTAAAAAEKQSLQLFEEGRLAYGQGDYETAIAKWEAGNAAKPSSVFEFNLAQAELKADRMDRAAVHFRKYLEMAPEADNRAEVEKVLGEIDAALARAESQKLFDSGNEKFQKEQYDEAISDWEAGYAKEPSAAFLYNIAQAHKLAGRKDEARTYLEKYLEASPDSPRRAEVEKEIKRLQRRR